MEPGLQQWEFGNITTMLPAMIKFEISQLIYGHHHSRTVAPSFHKVDRADAFD